MPGIPSAEEVAQKRMDLAKLNAMLLEKIKELTLYSIQLEKTSQQQSQELQSIKQKQIQFEQMIREIVNRK
ncbi:hypothetical protein SAMN05216167_13926 [Spirosoma endophyticum]|uniref:Uncharacterized protein n=1 Tax=Spirosoma endophyticum TaxID=662367 RepID=A0A1I2H9I6_9BACT|nr:hypothetical protein SAMN05216167_13926 [Spirosoma endophyticum]